LPDDFPPVRPLPFISTHLFANLFGRTAFFQVSAELLFDPDQGLITIATVLDHKAGHGQEMNLTVSGIREFEPKERVENRLAAQIRSVPGTT
jgi:hypothetical protein